MRPRRSPHSVTVCLRRAAVASRDVVRHFDVEPFGLEKGKAAGIAVDAIEGLIDQRLVTSKSTRVAIRSGHEWERGNP